MGSISKLDAVNHMLLLAGESLVSDLDDNSGLDTEISVFCLDQIVRDFQMRGLANNRYIKKEVTTETGTISLPTSPYDTISAELISSHRNEEGYNIIGVLKGSENTKYLWNVTDQTDEWVAGTYRIEIIQATAWEDMDTPVQRAILSSATRQYQMITQGDADTDVYLSGLEGLYMAKGKAADWDDRRRTVYSAASAKLRDAMNRRGYQNDASLLRYWRTTS
jgi:hypothetical protein